MSDEDFKAGREIDDKQGLIDDILEKSLGDEILSDPSFEQLKADNQKSEKRNMDFILDIPLEITVLIGRTRMKINDMLQLSQGSVIELDRNAGDKADVFVNGRLVAKGEVVVVHEKFGVRITDIVSQAERVKKIA